MAQDVKTISIATLTNIAKQNYEANPTPQTLITKVNLELKENKKNDFNFYGIHG